MPASRDHRTTPNPAGKKNELSGDTKPNPATPPLPTQIQRQKEPSLRLPFVQAPVPEVVLFRGGGDLVYSATKEQLE